MQTHTHIHTYIIHWHTYTYWLTECGRVEGRDDEQHSPRLPVEVGNGKCRRLVTAEYKQISSQWHHLLSGTYTNMYTLANKSYAGLLDVVSSHIL